MRKSTLLLVISLVFLASTLCGQMFDLDLENTMIPTSVTMGKTIPVSGDILNHGPDDYLAQDGKITMNVHARYTPLSPTDSFDVQAITSFDIAVNRIDAGQSISYTGGFTADSLNFRIGHSGVTVIVWPKISHTGGPGAVDTFKKNNYYFTQVNVDQAPPTGIDRKLNDFNIELYPNPAVEFVRISLENPLQGKLMLMDMQGRELAAKVVTPQSLDYEMGLSEQDIESGVYLMVFEGETGSWTEKLIVTNK